MKALIAATAAALATAGAAAGGPGTGQNGRIAFAEPVAGIGIVNPDGTGVLGLARSGGDDAPAWSPDGTRVAFDRGGDIWTMDADGGNAQNLTRSVLFEENPAWSPDGKKIAFDSPSPFASFDVYVMNADGTGVTRLTSDPARDAEPAWSPDGTKIAFVSERDGNAEIYVMKADGSAQTRLTRSSGIYPWLDGIDDEPAWSPDGAKIAFRTTRDAGQSDIYVMKADGSGEAKLIDTRANEMHPSWSPDGQKIAFAEDDGYVSSSDVYVANADGSGVVQVTTGGDNTAPSWQPVGAQPAGCTIWGTSGNDLLVGGAGADDICGLGGNDTLVGGGGGDRIDGGDGNDSIEGDAGADHLFGGPGDDTIDARDGSFDFVDGGPGFNTTLGDRHRDSVRNSVERFRASRDLALGKIVTASQSLALAAPAGVVNDFLSWPIFGPWNAGTYAPQWVEIDLGRMYRIAEIRLTVEQYPTGNTIHEVLAKGEGADASYHLMHVFNENTWAGEQLRYRAKRPWRGVRYVRVQTVSSPSWVSWRRIEVLAPR